MNYHGVEAVVQAHDRRCAWLAQECPQGRLETADSCFAAMVQAVKRQLQAKALRVDWITSAGASVCLHVDERCRLNPGLNLLLQTFAAQLADAAAPGMQTLTKETTSLHGELSAVALPARDGIVTVAALLEREKTSCEIAAPSTLGSLARILRPFLELWAAVQAQQVLTRGLARAVESYGIATFLADKQSVVLFANNAGKALVARGRGISIEGGRLAATGLADTMRLQAAVAHACGCGAASPKALPVVAIEGRGGRPLIATIAPDPSDSRGESEPSAVLYFFDFEEDFSPLIEPVCKIYDLSAGETRLTCRLANGQALAEAAQSIGVREQTARSYLKQIFLKTQTNRQGELVCLMLKSAVRIANAATARVY